MTKHHLFFDNKIKKVTHARPHGTRRRSIRHEIFYVNDEAMTISKFIKKSNKKLLKINFTD